MVGKLCCNAGSSKSLTDSKALMAPATGNLELIFLVTCNGHTKNPQDFGMGGKGIEEDLFSLRCTLCARYAKA